jgi:hypothetical protein
MADAQGSPAKPVKPIMPVMPVFPANWEPKMPTVRKAEAAKRLQAKAKADQGDVLARLLDEAQQAAATAVKTNQLADKSLSDFSLKVPSVQQLAAAKKAPVQGATGGSAYEDSSEGANVQYRAASTSGLGFAGGGDPYKYIRTGHYADALMKEADVQQGWLDAASPKVVKMDNGDDGKEAKAKATVSALAAGPAKPVLASAPAKPADMRSEWIKALNRPDSLPMVDGVEQDVVQHPVASVWNKALNRPMNIQKGPAQVLAAKEPSVEEAEAPKKPQAAAPKEPAHQEKKAVVEQARPQPVHDAPVVLKKPVTGEGLLAKWMQALGLSPAPNAGIKSPATTPATTPNKVPQSRAQQQQTQLANKPKAPAASVFAAKWEPLSKAAPTVALHAKTQTRKDWMAALGFSDEPVKQVHVAHSKPVLATKELPPSISSTPANVVSSKQNLEANAFPAYDDDDVPAANTGAARAAPVHAAAAVGKLQHAAQTEDASRRGGVLAEWFAALHRKPAKVLAFSDGGDGQRTPGEALPNARLSTAQTALAGLGKPLQEEEEEEQQQQQLVAKGAWAKALGVSFGAGEASPAPKSQKSAAKPKIDKDSLWGDVLVRVGTPVMPGASRMPAVAGDSGVPLFDVFASDGGSKLSRMLSAPRAAGKAGDKGKWENALQRPSAFKAQGAKQELVGLDHPLASKAGERFSTALMRDAVKEGKSPRVVALETAMRRNSVAPFVDPFSDESVPFQDASFRTLWNN